MAKSKPCRQCGHAKTKHTQNSQTNNNDRARCKYSYAARDGRNLHAGWDTDEHGHWKRDANGRSPRHYQCLCPKWLPEEIWRLDKETDEMVFLGYEDGLNADGTSPGYVLMET